MLVSIMANIVKLGYNNNQGLTMVLEGPGHRLKRGRHVYIILLYLYRKVEKISYVYRFNFLM